MLNENKIRCFLCLAEVCNFTTAAKMLFLSQQAVSKNISSLEEDLGVRLFYRNMRIVTLTTEGEAYYRLFKSLTAQYQTGVAEIQNSHESERESIRLGVQSYIAFGAVLDRVFHSPRLRDCFDLSVVREDPNYLLKQLYANQVDVIFIYHRFVPPESFLHTIDLSSCIRYLVVSPNNPLTVSEEVGYQAFANEPMIVESLYEESDRMYQLRVKKDMEELGLSPSKIIHVENRETAYTYADLGKGVLIGTDKSQCFTFNRLVRYPTESRDLLQMVWSDRSEKGSLDSLTQGILQEYKKWQKK